MWRLLAGAGHGGSGALLPFSGSRQTFSAAQWASLGGPAKDARGGRRRQGRRGHSAAWDLRRLPGVPRILPPAPLLSPPRLPAKYVLFSSFCQASVVFKPVLFYSFAGPRVTFISFTFVNREDNVRCHTEMLYIKMYMISPRTTTKEKTKKKKKVKNHERN